MLKRMLIFGLAITVISLLSTVTFATFSYDTTDDVTITLEIPSIQVLDMGASDNDITWVEITAADLDNGFVVRNSATSFTVDSNDPLGFEVVVSADGHFQNAGVTQTFSITSLHWKSYLVNKGTFTTNPTVQASWVTFDATSPYNATADVAESAATDQGKDCVIMLDYKVDMTWKTVADTYDTTLTFTLQSKS
ncbi:MAG: hypothetical protein KAU10_06845 [Dehalococcoidia bacterium]|nr:hypothetical protein [Dehalococcoidia bacterium]